VFINGSVRGNSVNGRLAELDRSAQQLGGRRESMCIQYPLPSRVIDQVTAGDAAESHEPTFEAAVPAVHILYVDRPA
jgi:hypothetical protein